VERESERDRETERETERQRERDRERDTHTERDTHRETDEMDLACDAHVKEVFQSLDRDGMAMVLRCWHGGMMVV
jgi:hypothetical protein